MTLSNDLFANGVAPVAAAIRQGNYSFSDLIQLCLERIDALDNRLLAFEHVAAKSALLQAAEFDKQLAAGEDLGPLMGMPIGVKDIINVSDMPCHNGSLHPQLHLNGPEGSVVQRLRQQGCIIIGKTRTVEYALGATGINNARGTPVNPWDSQHDRIPGGSSSGSAVAVAAGLCAFALGSDTGGSVRNPASLNGLVGHKTTVGLWPTDGVFPLSPTLDSIGPLCRTVADASLIHESITGSAAPAASTSNGFRLAIADSYFLADLDADVERVFNLAIDRLKHAGTTLSQVNLDEATERDFLFPRIVAAELLSALTPASFQATRQDMDSVTAARAEFGLGVSAVEYLQAQRRHREIATITNERISAFDAWICPTNPFTAIRRDHIEDGSQRDRALLASMNTMPVNLFGMCAITLPISQLGEPGQLPVGLQISCAAGEDAKLLSIAAELENLLGQGGAADLQGFIDAN